MATRGFGYQTFAGTSQPVFGTTITAATVLTPDQFTGRTNPGSNPSLSTTTVGAGFKFFFQKNDRVIVGPAAGNGPWDSGRITAVNTTTGAISIQGLTIAHASGEWIILCAPVADLRIECPTGNTALAYLGPDVTVAVASPTLARSIAANSAFELGISSAGNVWDTQAWWINGTSADKFLPSFVAI